MYPGFFGLELYSILAEPPDGTAIRTSPDD